jgi:hypothetical protein
MATVANKDDAERAGPADQGREPSESSGLSDIMEIAASLGIDEREGEARADDDEADDDNLSAGYGGSAAAALVADATVEPPAPVRAANAPKSDPKIPVAAPEAAKPPPPPPAKSSASSAGTSKASLAVAPPPTPAARAAASSAAMPVSAASVAAAPVDLSPADFASTPRRAAAPRKSNAGLWVFIAFALIAIGGAAAWLFVIDPNRGSETQVVSAEVTPPPAPEPEPEPPTPEPVAVAPVPVPPPVEEPVVEPVVEEPPAPPAAEEVQATVTKRKGKKGAAASGAAEEIVEEEESKNSPFEDKDDGKFSAECLLDPSKPGCEELLRKRRAGKGTDLDATLADKLSKAQIREGFSSVKGKAKACGGEPGTTVRVKVSISGDGDVISAEPLSPHDGGDAVGECVANALKDAKFDRFTAAQQGTTYPVQF